MKKSITKVVVTGVASQVWFTRLAALNPVRKSGKPDFRCDPVQAGEGVAFLNEMAGNPATTIENA
jgi:hypothetical protein